MPQPAQRVYTRQQLAHLHESYLAGQIHRDAVKARKAQIEVNIGRFITRIRNFAEKGHTACFIPDRQLIIESDYDVDLPGYYSEYIKGLRASFPDSIILDEENFDNKGRGIYIDWSV